MSQSQDFLDHTLEILPIIEVQPPYFALSHFYKDGEWLYARAPVQVHAGFESSVMDASEMGRHLAILGSCSGALNNSVKSKHYYLAYDAQLSLHHTARADSKKRSQFVHVVHVRSKSQFESKRVLKAEAEIIEQTDTGITVVASLSVRYHVMTERAFLRLYLAQEQQLLGFPHNPYAKAVPLSPVSLTERSGIWSIGQVLPTMCLGHFNKVKALPVAILCQCFVQAACLFLKESKGYRDFFCSYIDIQAEKLALTGEVVDIHVELIESSQDHYQFKTSAVNNKQEVFSVMHTQIEAR